MIYLASPYSHPKAEVRTRRYIQACKAAAELIRRGEMVFCPIAHSHGIAVHGMIDGDWTLWETNDAYFLSLCKSLVVLTMPGYQMSRGVQAEVKMANQWKLPIEYMEPIDGDYEQEEGDPTGLRLWVEDLADRKRPQA